jgi:hypothetical protein
MRLAQRFHQPWLLLTLLVILIVGIAGALLAGGLMSLRFSCSANLTSHRIPRPPVKKACRIPPDRA